MFSPSIALNVLLQLVEPSAEYSTVAPFSTPVTTSVPTVVILSPEMPVSLVSATVGVTTTVSYVNVKVADADTLPATSLCRTFSVMSPCFRLKYGLHEAPLSVEYSMRAPDSGLDTVISPNDVILSPFVPVSTVSDTIGVATTVSNTNSKGVLSDTFPAKSLCRTSTVLSPCTAVKDVVHVPPSSIEYSTVAPVSTPVTRINPTFVILSVGSTPVSLDRTTVGGAAAVS